MKQIERWQFVIKSENKKILIPNKPLAFNDPNLLNQQSLDSKILNAQPCHKLGFN